MEVKSDLSEKDQLIAEADSNFESFAKLDYPGRGIIMGLSEYGDLVQVYFVMGRSEGSRNRRLIVTEKGGVSTEIVDESLVAGDPDLLIYPAMIEKVFDTGKSYSGEYAVSNGKQTVNILNTVTKNLYQSMSCSGWSYEPDSLHTPRVSGSLAFNSNQAYLRGQMLVLKKAPFGDGCDSFYYDLNLSYSGVGYCITTYTGDNEDVRPFNGTPYLLPLKGRIDEVAKRIWHNLHARNRVALAVKFIDPTTGKSSLKVINKHDE